MQTHLKKLFPGTTGVKLGPGGLSITALCSHYGENFQLDHPVDIDCPVEVSSYIKSASAYNVYSSTSPVQRELTMVVLLWLVSWLAQ